MFSYRKQELVKIFQRFDANHSNSVSYAEARAVLKDFHFKLSDKEIRDMMASFDQNNDGQLQFEEFVHFWQALGGRLPSKKK